MLKTQAHCVYKYNALNILEKNATLLIIEYFFLLTMNYTFEHIPTHIEG